MTIANNRQLISILTLSVLTIAGCSRSDGSKPASQIAAKVNGDEITVHQLNDVLGRLGGAGAAAAPERIRTAALERLVDQQLTIQKAKEAKIDRDAAVMAVVESNRRQILSQAYIDRVAATVPPPTAEEIHDYYIKNPELFEIGRAHV